MRVQQQPQRREQLAKLQESLAITHDKLRNLTERAPVSGLLTGMDLKIGENRARGSRLAEITPDTGFNLLATVDEYGMVRIFECQRCGSIRQVIALAKARLPRTVRARG